MNDASPPRSSPDPEIRASDRIRATAVAVFAAGQILTTGSPALFGWSETVTSQVRPYEHSLTPVAYAFAIWGVIYAGAAAFVVWQLLPRNLANPLARRIGWLAAGMYAANCAWQIVVPGWGVNWPSSALLAGELALGVIALGRIRDLGRPLTRGERWLAAAPLGVLTGWASAATFVNLSTSALWAGGVPFDAREPQTALALLAGAIAFCAFAVNATRSTAQTLAIVWALHAIAVRNWTQPLEPAVALLAVAGIAVVLLAWRAPRWRPGARRRGLAEAGA